MAGAVYLLIAYAAISLAYSFAFKKFPLLDVFILASLYTLRIIAGGVASGLPVTLWLLAFSLFVFLSLALIKRTAELRAWLGSPEERSATRRGYVPGDRNLLLMFGVASSFASCVVLALFVSAQAALYQYRAPEILCWRWIPTDLFSGSAGFGSPPNAAICTNAPSWSGETRQHAIWVSGWSSVSVLVDLPGRVLVRPPQSVVSTGSGGALSSAAFQRRSVRLLLNPHWKADYVR